MSEVLRFVIGHLASCLSLCNQLGVASCKISWFVISKFPRFHGNGLGRTQAAEEMCAFLFGGRGGRDGG